MAPKKKPGRKRPSRNPNGRPPKVDADFLKRYEAKLADGAHPRTAFLAMGMSGDSWTRYLDKGKPDGLGNYPNTVYGKFCGLVDRAHALARCDVDSAVFKAAKAGDMGAARLYYTRHRVENFEPHNPSGLLGLAGVNDLDDDSNLFTALASRLVGIAKVQAGAAAEVPRGS